MCIRDRCERDRARAAVEVEHRLLPREARKFDGFRVEPLGLYAVCLLYTSRREQLFQSFGGQVLRLNGNDDSVRSGQRLSLIHI